MTAEIAFPAHPFWDFSLAVYGSPGVAAACLELQDRHEIDVNILLFCCWMGFAGHVCTAERMRDIVSAVDPWHRTVVRRLREVRRNMKAGVPGAPAGLSETLRRKIASAEVECEHVEQLMLADLAGEESVGVVSGEAGSAAARSNIDMYFNVLAKPIDTQDLQRIDVVLAAAGRAAASPSRPAGD